MFHSSRPCPPVAKIVPQDNPFLLTFHSPYRNFRGIFLAAIHHSVIITLGLKTYAINPRSQTGKMPLTFSKIAQIIRCTGSVTIYLAAISGFALQGQEQERQPDANVFFEENILPVLQKHCYKCHSAQHQSKKGGLRLDSPAAMRKGGNTGLAIVPDNAKDSLLINALRHEGLEMPPGKKLADTVIDDFVQWIEQGAPDTRPESSSSEATDHWAFQPLADPVPPQVAQESWVRNELDRFILQRLERENVKPATEAPPATLLRRLYLDLTGLPPTPAELKSFVSDTSDQAYSLAVERLLASKHYGERWGRYWLDMARYADSNGYESDRPRPHAWRWRDWVINALNEDMPFNRFTIEQLAGDLLPHPSLKQLIATGFNRNTLVNTEGGVDGEEDRVKRTVDRTNTLGKVWLGLTLGCTQCHSHKYDPITQHEYFSMYAFFNNVLEPDKPAPTAELLTKQEEALGAYQAAHAPFLKAIGDYRSDTFKTWLESLPEIIEGWSLLNPDVITTNDPDSKLELEKDLSIFATGPNATPNTYQVVARTTQDGISAIRLEVFADPRLPANGPGLATNGNFVLTSMRVFAKPASDVDPETKGTYFPLKTARADFSQAGRLVTSVLGDKSDNGWAIYPQAGQSHVAIFELESPIRNVVAGEELQLTIELEHELHLDHNIGRFRLSTTNTPQPVPMDLADAGMIETLKKPLNNRTGSETLRLIEFYDYREEGLDPLVQAEMEHRQQKPVPLETMYKAQTLAESQTPRETRVHERGDFLSKGDLVFPNTPAVLPPLTTRGKTPDRLDLARWLVAESNPLTTRVVVNRVWQQHFGRGLVVTDDDFGTQGELPSHPELLDWLARRFQQDGWSLKSLHRLIVNSATWRQSSATPPGLSERDPYNIWLSHQNRLRVEAEIVRDLALATSGLLYHQIGGPSVYPPQPGNLVKLGFQDSLSWPESSGTDRYRRGLYTFFQRTVPYPMLVQFDAADSNTSCTRRERSNTPLQALTLWNDAVFIECAQGIGRRVSNLESLQTGELTKNEQQISHLFQLCLSRKPTEDERNVLRKLFQSQFERYRQDLDSARTWVGDKPPESADALATRAALISLARVVMNLDEFITRE